MCDPRRYRAALGGAKLWLPPPLHGSNSSQPSRCAVQAGLLHSSKLGKREEGEPLKVFRSEVLGQKVRLSEVVAGREEEGVVVEGINTTSGCMPEELAEQEEGVLRGWDNLE